MANELTKKQREGYLIDMYAALKRIKKVAEYENAVETVKVIDDEIAYIKIKLQPKILPD